MVLDCNWSWLIESHRVMGPPKLKTTNILQYMLKTLLLLYQKYFLSLKCWKWLKPECELAAKLHFLSILSAPNSLTSYAV